MKSLCAVLAVCVLAGHAAGVRQLATYTPRGEDRYDGKYESYGPEYWLGKIGEQSLPHSLYDAAGILPPEEYVLDYEVPSAYIGVGTQNYTCEGGAYVPAGAIATLYSSATNKRAGHHYFGTFEGEAKPVFVLDDYGYVVGEVPPVNRIPSSMAGSADDLLLQVYAAEGVLAERGWAYINRVLTTGGKAPEKCEEEGEKTEIPYTTHYLFYAPDY